MHSLQSWQSVFERGMYPSIGGAVSQGSKGFLKGLAEGECCTLKHAVNVRDSPLQCAVQLIPKKLLFRLEINVDYWKTLCCHGDGDSPMAVLLNRIVKRFLFFSFFTHNAVWSFVSISVALLCFANQRPVHDTLIQAHAQTHTTHTHFQSSTHLQTDTRTHAQHSYRFRSSAPGNTGRNGLLRLLFPW